MSNVTHVNTVQIETGSNATASTGGSLRALKDGQFALVDAKTMKPLSSVEAGNLSANATVYIAMGTGSGNKLSSKIKGSEVTGYAGTAFTPSLVGQLSLGRSGAATFTDLGKSAETEYRLNIVINNDYTAKGQKQARDLFNYTTGSNVPVSSEVPFALASLFYMKKQNGSIKEYNNRYVDLTITDSGTFTTNADNDATVNKGSREVYFDTAATYDTGTAIAVGDYIKVKGTDSNGALNYSVYLVAGVAGNVVALDTPIIFAKGDGDDLGTIGAANIEVYDQAAADAVSFAFNIFGQTPSEDWNGIDTYEVVDFDASFFSPKTVDNEMDQELASKYVVQKMVPGAGNGVQIYDLEYFAEATGINSRTRWFDSKINPQSRVDVSKGYDIININFNTEYRTDFQNTAKAPKSTTIAFLSDPGNQSTSFLAVLNAYFGTKLGNEAVSF